MFSAGAAQHSFRHFGKAQPVRGWYRLKDEKKKRGIDIYGADGSFATENHGQKIIQLMFISYINILTVEISVHD